MGWGGVLNNRFSFVGSVVDDRVEVLSMRDGVLFDSELLRSTGPDFVL